MNPLQLSHQAAASEQPIEHRFYPYDYNGGCVFFAATALHFIKTLSAMLVFAAPCSRSRVRTSRSSRATPA